MAQRKIVRFCIKLVFIVGGLALFVSSLLKGKSALGGFEPGFYALFGLMGAAYSSVFARRICQLPPPSAILIVVQLAAVAIGYVLGQLVGMLLFQLIMSMGKIALAISVIVAAGCVIYSTALLSFLIPMAASCRLLDSEKEQLAKNLRFGCVPKEYQTPEGKEVLHTILLKQGINPWDFDE